MKKYMICSIGSQTNWESIPEDKQTELIHSFMAWVKDLQDQGRLVFHSALTTNSRVISKKDNHLIVDGPFVESKELITGAFVITAVSFEEALEIAKRCPGTNIGEHVTLTEMQG